MDKKRKKEKKTFSEYIGHIVNEQLWHLFNKFGGP
jgi:hypothetical protein